jgi:hypothetical protein
MVANDSHVVLLAGEARAPKWAARLLVLSPLMPQGPPGARNANLLNNPNEMNVSRIAERG